MLSKPVLLQDFWFHYRHLARSLNKEEQAIKNIICGLMNLTPTAFYLSFHAGIEEEIKSKLEIAINRYLYQNEPVQYILNMAYFYGLKLYVNKNVLIPRPETEELVEIVIKNNQLNNPIIVDIGTGSGAIALALKKHIPDSVVYATDISIEALDVARRNAKELSLDVSFLLGDLFAAFDKKANMIVSNPPYIDLSEEVESIVKDNEPHLALYAQQKGLFYYEAILSQAKVYLETQFLLAFEIPMDKDEQLLEIANRYFFGCDITILKDLTNRSRILLIKSK